MLDRREEKRKFRSDKSIIIEEKFIFLSFSLFFFSKVITIDVTKLFNKEILFR